VQGGSVAASVIEGFTMNDWLERDLTEPDDDNERRPVITDELIDQMARLELAQRFLWAVEVGVDPLRGDLLTLPGAPCGRIHRAA
jgi:hypothetical protein